MVEDASIASLERDSGAELAEAPQRVSV